MLARNLERRMELHLFRGHTIPYEANGVVVYRQHTCRLEESALKAGKAGSNPDDAATPQPGPIQPLTDFLGEVGEAVGNLNTAVVGLDAVEKGHEKPATLSISWNPRDRVAAARKARRFVLEAVLVRVAEALQQFVRAAAQLPRFKAVRENWAKSKTSNAEKLADFTAETLGDESYLSVGATLLVHWRNRVVHPRSRAELSAKQRKTLTQSANEIEQNFAGLSVEKLLHDFEVGHPTLKDISSLIAMSIKMARAVDREINQLSGEDLETLLDYYDLRSKIEMIEVQTTPAKRSASVQRLLQSVAPGLAQSYRRLHMDGGCRALR
jgi:hypothetical protein